MPFLTAPEGRKSLLSTFIRKSEILAIPFYCVQVPKYSFYNKNDTWK